MRFEEKLRKSSKGELWQEYCGFLDLTLDKYMFTQRRLMEEQIRLWSSCPLGRKILAGKTPTTIEEFLREVPLTKYEDYADTLLPKREDELPAKPAIWIQTTWEGGLRPVKTAPYSRAMLDVYRHNLISTMMMASSKGKGDFNVQAGDRILYGGAPLPYATGLMPSLFDEDIHFEWLPDTNAHSELSFSERIKKGFEMAFSGGMDFFFGLGSVSNYITENFSASCSGGGSGCHRGVTPGAALRFMKGKYKSKQEDRPMLPKDVFKLKALFYAGTDAACYRQRLTEAWGSIPVEIAAGTESTCIGSETWERNGMVFFPNACFYEFIPLEEMERNLENPDYVPRTCLMDKVQTGAIYELVISVLNGGSFMRYRIGDLYRCVSGAGNNCVPRFAFLDRIPSVIDIAGFTRITEDSVKEVVKLTGIKLGRWLLKKEFDATGIPFLHMYVEIPPETQLSAVTTISVITDCLSVYFKYFDSDYSDLKKLLNIEPLKVTILKHGSIDRYEDKIGKKIRRINPGQLDIAGIMEEQEL